MLVQAQLERMNTATTQAWNPAHYDSAAAFVPKLGADLLDLVAPRPGERVLDLGSGTGELAFELTQRGARVIGLDASRAMVEEAQRKYPQLDFRVGDGQELSFDGELDAVFSNATLHWMPRADDVASGVARALRPGGRFVAEFGGAQCVRTVRSAVASALEALGLQGLKAPSWYFPSVPEYATVLERAGLFVRSLVWFERPTPLAGEAGLSTWLELFCLPLLRTLGDRREELLRHVEASCRPTLFRDGTWWLDYTRLRVVASKPALA
jgi:trans-aconitate methyltransferase